MKVQIGNFTINSAYIKYNIRYMNVYYKNFNEAFVGEIRFLRKLIRNHQDEAKISQVNIVLLNYLYS